MANKIEKATKRILLVQGSDQQGHPYSMDEVKSNLDTGLIRSNDLAWCVGMSEWVPLSKVIEDAESTTDFSLPLPSGEKVSAAELGAAGFNLAGGFEEAYSAFIQELQAEATRKDIDLTKVWVEMICLGVFAVNYGLFNNLKDGARDAVLNEFRLNLKRLEISGVDDSYKTITSRIYFYAQVIRKTAIHPEDIARKVGKRFAMFCGVEQNRQLVKIGGSVFENIMGYVNRWVKEIGQDNITA